MSDRNLAYLFEEPETPQDQPAGSWLEIACAGAKNLWEQERPQRILWVPVLWAVGSGCYFLLPFEPPRVIAITLAVILAGLAWLVPQARTWFLVLLLVCCGMVAAQVKANVLRQNLVSDDRPALTYFATVDTAEKLAKGGIRLHLQDLQTPGEAAVVPKRVRVLARTNVPKDLSRGQRISLSAVLTPLPRPVLPGGYDFGRNLFLDGYGATGFAVSDVTLLSNPLTDAKTSSLYRARRSIDAAISDNLDGASAGLAKALLLGNKSEIPQDVKDAYRQAGLAHLLAISGLHMALVAGFVFLLVRQGLALVPSFALTFPLKAIAAAMTIAALLAYLGLVGAPISAQRATLMASCVMLAIIFGRSAISLRTTALAACVLLVFWPENVVDIGFQMSFAAVIALISGYEAMAGPMSRLRERLGPTAGGIATYVAGVTLSTVLAEIAIFPLSLFHFNEITAYGLVGNAIAVPLTGFWIMPMGILAVLLTPLGLEAPALFLMGLGLDFVTAIATDIAQAPGSFIAVRSPPLLAILVFFAGGLWLCIWRTQIRFAGVIALFCAPFLAFPKPAPTLLISESGARIALRTASEGYVMLQGRRSSFAADVWARSVGQNSFDDVAGAYKSCDALGCSAGLWLLEDGTFGIRPLSGVLGVAPPYTLEIVKHPAALQDACRPTSIIISRIALGKSAKTICPLAELLLDYEYLAQKGPVTLTLISTQENIAANTETVKAKGLSLTQEGNTHSDISISINIEEAYEQGRPWSPSR